MDRALERVSQRLEQLERTCATRPGNIRPPAPPARASAARAPHPRGSQRESETQPVAEAATSRQGERSQQSAEPPAATEAERLEAERRLSEAHAVLDDALHAGTWTRWDAQRFREVVRGLPPAQHREAMLALTRALNEGRLTSDPGAEL